MKNTVRLKGGFCLCARRLVCLFMAFAIALFTFSFFNVPSRAAIGTKDTTSRAIAIVFDNSGSMYRDTAWSRATYAMEVFASMANEGDEIVIYPMNPITAGGNYDSAKNTLTLTGGESDAVSVIRGIDTPGGKNGDTPIETITDAYNGLADMTADEKWLVVLTDGDKFYQDGIELSNSDTEVLLSETLTKYNDSVNLMYLGIGSGAAEPTVEGGMQSSVVIAKDSAQILSKLTDMCNAIYGRDELDANGDAISFDLSMTKLILFVQGSGISNLRLVDASGAEAGTPISTYDPSHPDSEDGFPVDETLSGQIVTYGDVAKGDYTLSYDGEATSVGVYYEPNVSITAFLTDENGVNVMEMNENEVYPGTYKLQYGLVDEYGNLTDSPLLGDRTFTIDYSINGNEYTETMNENGSIDIELSEGDEIEARVEATYLSGYRVSTDSDDSWPFPITISPTPVYDLTGTITGGADSYSLPELENEGVYELTLKYEDAQLTGDELKKVDLDIAFDKDGAPDAAWEIADDGNGIEISLKYPGGDADAIVQQDYVMTVTPTMLTNMERP